MFDSHVNAKIFLLGGALLGGIALQELSLAQESELQERGVEAKSFRAIGNGPVVLALLAEDGAAIGQRPDVRPVVDFVRRYGVAVAVACQKGDRTTANLAEGHRPRWFSIRCAQDFAMRYIQIR